MKLEIKCPYCGSRVTTEVDTDETPIRGSITEDCPQCSVEIDIIRYALFALEREAGKTLSGNLKM